MGCLVQAIGETLVTKVSVEIGKHISLLSNQALGPVLHSLIQMRVPHMGLAKIDSRYLSLSDTHIHTHKDTSIHSFDLFLQPVWRIFCTLSPFIFPSLPQQWCFNVHMYFWPFTGLCGSGPWSGNCASSDSRLGWGVHMCPPLQRRWLLKKSL